MEVGSQLAASIETDLQLEHRFCLCFRLIPRCMVNVSQIDLSFNLLGETLLAIADQQLQERCHYRIPVHWKLHVPAM